MVNKNFATIKKMQESHRALQDKFKDNIEDIKLAQDLEEFFNYIVYDTENTTLSKSNMFSKNINNELRNQLRNSTYIKKLNILHNVGGQQQLSGQAGEEAISFLLLQAIQNIEQNNKVKTLLSENIDKLVKQMVIGDWRATTVTEGMAKEIVDNAVTQGKKQLTGLKKEYGVYALRQGKVDIDTSQIILEYDFSDEARKLLNLTASVKNYQRATVHLETVNRQKAYQGIMATLYPDLSNFETEKIYSYYYEKQKNKNSDYLSEHFLHIVNLYALAGLGQTYFKKFNEIDYQTINFALGARFLIANISSLKKIIVVPVAEIATNIAKSKYKGLFSYEGKEVATWENQKSIPVYLNLQKYKNLTS